MPVTDSPVLFALLCVNSAIGCVLVAGAYDLKGLVLGWTGWIGGALGGGAVGWLVVPELAAGGIAPSERLVATAVLVLIGAVIGRVLLPVVAQFAVAIAAFLFSTLATLVLTVGESILDVVYAPTDPSDPTLDAIDVEGVAEAGLLAHPEIQQFLIVSVVVGSVAGILAMRYYDAVMSVALTGLGAGLLATTAPVWHAVLAGRQIAITQQAELSTSVFVVVLMIGVGIQYVRHGRTSEC